MTVPEEQEGTREPDDPGAAPAEALRPAREPSALAARRAGDDELPARSNASAEALRELAVALRTSMEAMHGVRELQGDLVRTLKRQDRSELVLQSTKALNDSFRNLATIQRELLSRLDTQKTPSPGVGRLVPLLLLGLLVVFLGGTWVVLDVVERSRAGVADPAALAQQAAERALAARREGQAEGAAVAERELKALEAQLRQAEAREQALREEKTGTAAEREALERELRAAEGEVQELAAQVRAAQAEAIARRAVETELQATTARLAVTEPRLEQLELDLAAQRSENARLRQRMAAYGMGLPEPPAEAGPAPEAPGPEPSGTPPAPAPDRPASPEPALPPPGGPTPRPTPDVAAAPPDASAAPTPPAPFPPPRTAPGTSPPSDPAPSMPPPARVDRDAALLGKIRSRLNQLLDQSSQGRGDLWQVTRVGGVAPDRLIDVTAMRYDRASGRLLETVEAGDVRVQVSAGSGETRFVFRDGRVQRNGATAPLQGALSAVVAQGDMSLVWKGSGMLFVETR